MVTIKLEDEKGYDRLFQFEDPEIRIGFNPGADVALTPDFPDSRPFSLTICAILAVARRSVGHGGRPFRGRTTMQQAVRHALPHWRAAYGLAAHPARAGDEA